MGVRFGKDVRLSGDFRPSDSDRAVILCHGFGVDSGHDMYQALAGKLSRKGLSTLKFDFSGCGSSGGEHVDRSFRTEVRDIREAKKFLREKLSNPDVFLIGHSRCAVSVLLYARTYDVEGVVSCCPPEDLTEGWTDDAVQKVKEKGFIEHNGLKIGREMWEEARKYRRTSSIAAEVETPSLLIKASQDKHTGDTKSLEKEFDEKLEFDTGHYLSGSREDVANAVNGWIQDVK